MTVSLPPRAELKTKSLSAAQRREIALGYIQCPHGAKQDYAASMGVRAGTVRQWVAALADGDLETGLLPRKTGRMTGEDVAEIRRLERALVDKDKIIARMEAEKAREAAEFATQRQKWEETDAAWRRAVDGLGKAIEVMQKRGTS